MLKSGVQKVAKRIVSELSEVGPADEVQVITDGQKMSVARAIAQAARNTGAVTTLQVMPRADVHSEDPPPTVAAGMIAADVSFHVTTKALSHTDATRDAIDAGTRVIIMRGITETMMTEGGVNTDYEELAEVTTALRAVVEAGDDVHITTSLGTDLRMDLSDRPAWAVTGRMTDVGFAALPPGKISTAPIEGTGEGTAVIDYSMDNLGPVDDPIELTIEGGRVTETAGGTKADTLRKTIAAAGANAENLAEFALGTNRDARLVGNLAEDKKRRGTAHIALGDNSTIGGTVKCDLHLDGLMVRPTVRLDGEVIVEDGQLAVDRVRTLAKAIAPE